MTYPPNGEGLDQFPWKIDDDGKLIIDLRPDDDATGRTTTDDKTSDGNESDGNDSDTAPAAGPAAPEGD